MVDVDEEVLTFVSKANFSDWDIRKLSHDFHKQIGKSNTIFDTVKYYRESPRAEENAISRLFGLYSVYGGNLNWATDNIGTFFVKSILNFGPTTEDDDIEIGPYEINDIFTMQSDNVSLPDIVTLFDVVDVRGAYIDTPMMIYEEECQGDYWICVLQSPIKKRKSTFKDCFDNVSSKLQVPDANFEDWTSSASLKLNESFHVLPCQNYSRYPLCKEYCNWHGNFVAKTPKLELLTMMKYAQPQGKLVIDEKDEEETKLAHSGFFKVQIWLIFLQLL